MNLREELQKDPIIRKSRQNWLDGIVDPVLDEQATERERALFTYYHGLAHARKDGLEEGRAEGKTEGLAEGIEIGIEKGKAIGKAEAHDQLLKTARKLKSRGVSVEDIAESTGLPVSEIQAM